MCQCAQSTGEGRPGREEVVVATVPERCEVLAWNVRWARKQGHQADRKKRRGSQQQNGQESSPVWALGMLR